VAVGHDAAAAGAASLVDAAKARDHAGLRALIDQRVDPNTREADGTTALHWAAFNNDQDAVDLLIRAGADAKAVNAFGSTPLALAASGAGGGVVAALLDAGADPNTAFGQGETALMMASRTGRLEVVSVLLARGAQVHAATNARHTALMFAASEGHLPVVKALLAAGARLTDRSSTPPARRPRPAPANGQASNNAIVSASTDVVPGTPNPHNGRPIKDIAASMVSPPLPPGGLTPFLFAVRDGRIDTVRYLLEAGVDPNEKLPDGSTALVLATTNAHYELALLLVDKGADPNAAENGWTALHALTWVRRPNFGFNPPAPTITGSVEGLAFAKALVARGANVNARITKEVTNGYRNVLNRIGATPLLMAARLADAPLMRVLAELGADPTITTEDKSTVLMVAAGVGIHSPGEDPGTEEEALECVKVAIDLGGDVNARDDDDETALHGAAYRGAPSIVQYLVDHGAKTFDVKNIYGWTPLRIAEGLFRTATYKESPPTAVLLRALMVPKNASAPPAPDRR
jgi:ankyrin repeat protein